MHPGRIKPLEDMSLGHRVMLTVAVVLIVLLVAACVGYLSGRWEVAAESAAMSPSKFDDRLLALDREAVDNAYRSKIEGLIAVWLKDETGQPQRAVNGARNARKAYIAAMTEVEKREAAR